MLIHNYDKCPKILNTLYHTFLGLNCAFYAVVSFCGMANSGDP